MNALFRTSPNWDFVGQPRLVVDDVIERRAEALEREYAVDPARVSETICESLVVIAPYSYTNSRGDVIRNPGDKTGMPLIQLLLAGDDLAFCAALRERIAIKAKADAEHDAANEVYA